MEWQEVGSGQELDWGGCSCQCGSMIAMMTSYYFSYCSGVHGVFTEHVSRVAPAETWKNREDTWAVVGKALLTIKEHTPSHCRRSSSFECPTLCLRVPMQMFSQLLAQTFLWSSTSQ